MTALNATLRQIVDDAHSYRLGEASGVDDPDLDEDDAEHLAAQDTWTNRLNGLAKKYVDWSDHRDTVAAAEDDGDPPPAGAWHSSDDTGIDLLYEFADLLLTIPDPVPDTAQEG